MFTASRLSFALICSLAFAASSCVFGPTAAPSTPMPIVRTPDCTCAPCVCQPCQCVSPAVPTRPDPATNYTAAYQLAVQNNRNLIVCVGNELTATDLFSGWFSDCVVCKVPKFQNDPTARVVIIRRDPDGDMVIAGTLLRPTDPQAIQNLLTTPRTQLPSVPTPAMPWQSQPQFAQSYYSRPVNCGRGG